MKNNDNKQDFLINNLLDVLMAKHYDDFRLYREDDYLTELNNRIYSIISQSSNISNISPLFLYKRKFQSFILLNPYIFFMQETVRDDFINLAFEKNIEINQFYKHLIDSTDIDRYIANNNINYFWTHDKQFESLLKIPFNDVKALKISEEDFVSYYINFITNGIFLDSDLKKINNKLKTIAPNYIENGFDNPLFKSILEDKFHLLFKIHDDYLNKNSLLRQESKAHQSISVNSMFDIIDYFDLNIDNLYHFKKNKQNKKIPLKITIPEIKKVDVTYNLLQRNQIDQNDHLIELVKFYSLAKNNNTDNSYYKLLLDIDRDLLLKHRNDLALYLYKSVEFDLFISIFDKHNLFTNDEKLFLKELKNMKIDNLDDDQIIDAKIFSDKTLNNLSKIDNNFYSLFFQLHTLESNNLTDKQKSFYFIKILKNKEFANAFINLLNTKPTNDDIYNEKLKEMKLDFCSNFLIYEQNVQYTQNKTRFNIDINKFSQIFIKNNWANNDDKFINIFNKIINLSYFKYDIQSILFSKDLELKNEEKFNYILSVNPQNFKYFWNKVIFTKDFLDYSNLMNSIDLNDEEKVNNLFLAEQYLIKHGKTINKPETDNFLIAMEKIKLKKMFNEQNIINNIYNDDELFNSTKKIKSKFKL